MHIVLLDYRDITNPLAGGAEAYLNESFQRVAARGHRVTLVCSRYRGAPAEERVGNFRVLRHGSEPIFNFAGAAVALRLARREPVDLYVENICKIPFFLPALTRTPVLAIVLHLLGETVFHETNPAFASYVWLYERLIPRVYGGCRVVAISASTAADLRGRGLRGPEIDIVSPGLNLEDYRSGAAVPKSEQPLLVYLGMLKRYKGIDVVIRAFAQVRASFPAARLCLIGKGNDRPRLERIVGGLGLENAVTFAGYASDEEKIAWLHRAHAVVYPSLKEGWGIPAMEAAACGTPAIASDVNGLRDAIVDGSTGLLVPHGDAGAWAAAMIRILTDAALRDRLGNQARARAQAFSWEAQAEKMRAVVESIRT